MFACFQRSFFSSQLTPYRRGLEGPLTQGGRELVQAVKLGRTPKFSEFNRIDNPFGEKKTTESRFLLYIKHCVRFPRPRRSVFGLVPHSAIDRVLPPPLPPHLVLRFPIASNAGLVGCAGCAVSNQGCNGFHCVRGALPKGDLMTLMYGTTHCTTHRTTHPYHPPLPPTLMYGTNFDIYFGPFLAHTTPRHTC